MDQRPKLLFVINADWFFLSHYLSIAKAALNAGSSVTVLTGDTGRISEIVDNGLNCISLPINRSSLNPVTEARTQAFLIRAYRQHKPDLIHHVTIKPVIYGTIAARLSSRAAVVNTISGRGYLFASKNRARKARFFVNLLYKIALSHPRSLTLFQNPSDRDEFIKSGIVTNNHTELIPGSGVDCTVFIPTPEPTGIPIVMLPSRMLWDKGINEYIEAARILKKGGTKARFVLVGDVDSGNQASIPDKLLKEWVKNEDVEWWGHSNDMPLSLSKANIVVLPSYREGLPKVLVEAAASSRALIATNIPGCRDVVEQCQNGLLVTPKDSIELARAIGQLLNNQDLRKRFAKRGREIALSRFSQEIVIDKMLDIYNTLLGKDVSSDNKTKYQD